MMRVLSDTTWSPRKIWNCFDIVNGATPASGTAHFWDGEISWVGPADLGKLSSRVISRGERNLTESGYKSCGTTFVPAGTIILSARAPIGHVAVAANRLCFNQGCKGLVPNADIFGEFAYWLILALKPKLEAAGQGTTFVELSRSKLKDVTFLLPPLPEQRAIAAFLDGKCATIDEAVRIKEEQIRLLAERRQILIQEAVTRGLNPNAPMKDSRIDWIGQIPAHWVVRRNFALFRETKNAGNAGLPVLSVSIHSGVSKEELSEEENIRSIIKIEDRSSYKEVLPGDIAYNMMRAWQGGIGAVHTHGMVSPAYVVVRPIVDLVADYFELLYRTPAFIRQMDASSKGITDFRKRLYWDDFRDCLTIVPPKAEQEEIIRYSSDISAKFHHAISLKESQITALREYKTSLINAAVTGKIKVL
ncbi:MAG: restriction endonuclease subunit S [Gluconobacter albidus]